MCANGRETDKIYLHPKINRIICRISINYLSCIMLNLKCYRDEKVFSEINAVSGIGFGGVIRVQEHLERYFTDMQDLEF